MFPQRRRGQHAELGVMLLIMNMLNFGLNNIPKVTLFTIIGQTLLYMGYIKVPWSKWDVCISADYILKHGQYKRILISCIEHADDMHLYYNMISFMIKGKYLEERYRSSNFAFLLLIMALLTSGLYVALGVIASNVFFDDMHRKTCAIGFSGVIFALKTIASNEEPYGTTYIQGIPVSSRNAAWLELVLIHIMVPHASFMGHLAGILAGLLYIKTPVGKMIDTFIKNITGEPIFHTRDFI